MAILEYEMIKQEQLAIQNFSSQQHIINIKSAESLTTQGKIKTVITIPSRIIIKGSKENFTWESEKSAETKEVPSFKVDNLPITWGDIDEYITKTKQKK